MILLDTHTLFWWTKNSPLLSKIAREHCENHSSIAISSISIWEIGLLVRKSRIKIPGSLREYTLALESIMNFKILPVTTNIWLMNDDLDWKHRDPADRTIVSTAIVHKTKLLTKDKNIHQKFPNIALW